MKEIIHYLGLLLLFISIVISGLFWKGSSLILAFIFGGIVFIFLKYFLVRIMIRNKKETHRKSSVSILHWILYIFLAISSSLISIHFITIQFFAKDDIVKDGNKKLKYLEEITNIFADSTFQFQPNRVNIETKIYKKVKNAMEKYVNADRVHKDHFADTLKKYGLSSSEISKVVPNRIDNRAKYHTSNIFTKKIEDLHSEVTKEIMRYKIENNNIFNDWQFFKIHDVYYELDIIINTNIEKIEIGINEIFNKQANKILTFEGNSYKPDIYSKFKFELRKEEYTEMNNLLGIQSKYSNEYLISSLLYLLIHLFILFPILLTFKSGKKPKGGESLRKLFN